MFQRKKKTRAGFTYSCIVGGVLLVAIAPGRLRPARKQIVQDMKSGTFGLRSALRAARAYRRGAVEGEIITPSLSDPTTNIES